MIVAEYGRDDEGGVRPGEAAVAKMIGECLEFHYSGHAWCVQVDAKGGIARIWLPILRRDWGYVVHLSQLAGDPRMRAVVRAGGEMLERFGIRRSGFSSEDYARAVRGRAIGDFTR